MWDYDKLFAEGNVVGIKNEVTKEFGVYQITHNKELPRDAQYFQYGRYWDGFANTLLARSDIFIQYIIRLDEHGNVVEKLFDRKRDMEKPMPELETGMFVRVIDNGNMDYTVLGYVDIQNCRIIYQDGKYNDIVKLKKLTGKVDIVEIYSQRANCFNQCLGHDTLIWRSLDYQDYLDSKN